MCFIKYLLLSTFWFYILRKWQWQWGFHFCRYIYVPVGGSRRGFARQIAGSFLAFAFIWLWHGSNMHIMWWCIPNWLGVVVESLAGTVLLFPPVKRLEVSLVRLLEISTVTLTAHINPSIMQLFLHTLQTEKIWLRTPALRFHVGRKTFWKRNFTKTMNSW